MQFTPRPYQRTIIDNMLDIDRCGVWAGMGLGKTVSALTALDLLQLTERGPALVLAPLRVASSTWPTEARKWDHLQSLQVVPIVGTVAQRQAALRKRADVYTTNYENLPWLIEVFKADWPFTTIIADESTKLKGFRLRQGTQRARALAKVAHNKVRRFVNLTGTPAPNGLIDLWGQTWFLDEGQRLGRTFASFESRWFRSERVGDNPHAKRLHPLPFAQEEIEQRLRDITISLDARDYFDLREPIINNIRVELPKKARRLYDDMEREMFVAILGTGIEAVNAASKTTKCLQLANGAIYTDETNTAFATVHDVKIDALHDIVEEAAGMPVMVAYHFRHDLVRLQQAFPQGRVLDANPRTIDDWNAGKIPVLFAHPQSAGHGLNLQDGGNQLVFFGHWWNLEEYQQIIERIGPTRQAQAGHDRPVFIHHIIAAGTVDELVMLRRQSKRELQDLLLEAMNRRKR